MSLLYSGWLLKEYFLLSFSLPEMGFYVSQTWTLFEPRDSLEHLTPDLLWIGIEVCCHTQTMQSWEPNLAQCELRLLISAMLEIRTQIFGEVFQCFQNLSVKILLWKILCPQTIKCYMTNPSIIFHHVLSSPRQLT